MEHNEEKHSILLDEDKFKCGLENVVVKFHPTEIEVDLTKGEGNQLNFHIHISIGNSRYKKSSHRYEADARKGYDKIKEYIQKGQYIIEVSPGSQISFLYLVDNCGKQIG